MTWCSSWTAPIRSNTRARAPPVMSARSSCRRSLPLSSISARAARCRAERRLPHRRAGSVQAGPLAGPDRAVHEQTRDRRRGGGRLRQRSCRRQCRRADCRLRQIYRRRNAARDRQSAATARPACDRRCRRRAARQAQSPQSPTPQGGADRPLGLAADTARRPDRGKRAALHRRRDRRFRGARSA